MSRLIDPNHIHVYKPFHYPWAFDAWQVQQKIHWLPEEVPMADDVKDWKITLTAEERNLLTQVFRFFVQADIEVSNNYQTRLAQVFKPTEVQIMLAAFANIESIHIVAYSLLLDTVGMPELEYSAFLNYKEMKDKYDYLQAFNVDTKRDIAKTLAAFGAFTEGVALFASFAILLNFPRHNKMRGMGQIIAWSQRDEDLHAQSIIKLFRAFILENPEVWDDTLKREIYEIAEKTIELEDNFIDLAFEQGGIQGLTPTDVKQYIRYIADRRLLELGMKPIFRVKDNPLPWVETLGGGALEHANFFENRATAYSKASSTGDWESAYAAISGNEWTLGE